jgi:hypothetical protein
MSEGGMVRLTYEKWAELEALRRENEYLRAGKQKAEDAAWPHWATRLLHGQEQLRAEIERLRAELADTHRELADTQRELADARHMHGGGNPAS